MVHGFRVWDTVRGKAQEQSPRVRVLWKGLGAPKITCQVLSLASYLRWAPEGVHERGVQQRCQCCRSMITIPSHLDKGKSSGTNWAGQRYSAPLHRGFGFSGALRGQPLAALVSSVDWAVRGTYRTAWAVDPRCRCSYSYGWWVSSRAANRRALLGVAPRFVESSRSLDGTLKCQRARTLTSTEVQGRVYGGTATKRVYWWSLGFQAHCLNEFWCLSALQVETSA